MYWRRFAHQMKSQGRETVYNAMVKRDPKHIEGHRYQILLDNTVQLNYVQGYLDDLLAYLHEKLENYRIELELLITEDQSDEIKFRTGKDRYELMARKNPGLHILKKMFNLDIEY